MKGVFELHTDINGTRVVAVKSLLHPACMSDGEIEYHINSLKSQLDALVPKMKKAAREQQAKPLF